MSALIGPSATSTSDEHPACVVEVVAVVLVAVIVVTDVPVVVLTDDVVAVVLVCVIVVTDVPVVEDDEMVVVVEKAESPVTSAFVVSKGC